MIQEKTPKMEEVQEIDKKEPFSIDIVSVRLVKDASIYSEQPFDNPQSAVLALGEILCEFDGEVICVINLRNNFIPINVNFASIGTLNEAMASPREILKTSILSNAASIMLMHCHPSGKLEPSREDIMMTDRMNQICELVGISLTDHIIVGGDSRKFFSFREKGMITKERLMLETDYYKLDIGHLSKEEHKKNEIIRANTVRKGR